MTVELHAEQSGGAVNAVLDPIFIFSLGMGFHGAAIATAIAGLDADTRAALMLRGLVQIPVSAYLSVPTPDAPVA